MAPVTISRGSEYVDPGISTFKTSLRSGGAQRTTAKAPPGRQSVTADEMVTERPPTGRKESSRALVHTHTIRGHQDEVLCVAADGDTLLSGSKDKTARVWDVGTGTFKGCLGGHEYHVKAVAAIPARIYTASKGTVRLWDARTNECMQSFVLKKRGASIRKDTSDISDLAIDPHGTYMYAVAGKSVRVWDLRLSEEIKVLHLKTKVQRLAVQHHSDLLAVGCMDHKVRLFDVSVPETPPPPFVLEPPHYDQVFSVSFCGGAVFSSSRDFSIKRWQQGGSGEWSNTQTQSNAHGAGAGVTCLLGLGDNGCLLSGSARGSLKLWDPLRLDELAEVDGHNGAVNALAVSGNRVYSAGRDRTVRVWQYSEPAAIKQRGRDGDSTTAAQKAEEAALAGASLDDTFTIESSSTPSPAGGAHSVSVSPRTGSAAKSSAPHATRIPAPKSPVHPAGVKLPTSPRIDFTV